MTIFEVHSCQSGVHQNFITSNPYTNRIYGYIIINVFYWKGCFVLWIYWEE